VTAVLQQPANTIVDALYAAPADAAFVTMWRSDDDFESVTFGDFLRRASRQAARMRDHGATVGRRVVLVMPHGIPLMTAFVGAMMIGAVPAILAYPNFKVEPAKYRAGLSGVTKNLGATLVILDEAFPEELISYVESGEGTMIVRGAAGPAPSAVEGRPMISLDPADIAFIQHSAGTTGLQKAVALSHHAVLRQLQHLAGALRIDPNDRIYSWLPLYHDMGLIACFVLPLVYHVPVIMQAPDDWVIQPLTMMELIGRFRCTLAWVPNFALQFLARRVRPEDREELDLSSLRIIVNCSEPVRAQSMDEFTSAYSSCGLRSLVLQSSYAMAENVFGVTQSDLSQDPARLWVDGERLRNEQHAVPVTRDTQGSLCLVSSGRCLPNNEVRIVAPDCRDLPEGGVGEILVRSDSLFTGYYNRTDLTAAAIKDGWYYSGDLGFVRDGEIYVIGRKKDLIIVAGKNIHPQDIEEIVSRHPQIHDGRAVAFGLYNPDLGTEDAVAVAEVHDEKEIADAIAIERSVRNAVVAELGIALRKLYVKPPRWLVKSTAGKPARAATRDKLLAEHPELNRAAM
jgi:fatty-acyl-CoA synthase